MKKKFPLQLTFKLVIHSQTSWPYLISELLVAGSSWLRTYFTPQMFLFSIVILVTHLELALLLVDLSFQQV